MKYSLRTMMIAVLVLPLLLAGGWFVFKRIQREPGRIFSEEIVIFHHLPYREDFDTTEAYQQELQRYVPGDGGWKRLPDSSSQVQLPSQH